MFSHLLFYTFHDKIDSKFFFRYLDLSIKPSVFYMTSIAPSLTSTLGPLVLSTTTANPFPNTAEYTYAFDFFFAYLVAPICFFGVVTNLLNFIVFSNSELEQDTYKYLKMNAFSNLIYLLICGLVFTKRCGQFCELDKTYLTQVYYWIFYIYIKGNIKSISL